MINLIRIIGADEVMHRPKDHKIDKKETIKESTIYRDEICRKLAWISLFHNRILYGL